MVLSTWKDLPEKMNHGDGEARRAWIMKLAPVSRRPSGFVFELPDVVIEGLPLAVPEQINGNALLVPQPLVELEELARVDHLFGVHPLNDVAVTPFVLNAPFTFPVFTSTDSFSLFVPPAVFVAGALNTLSTDSVNRFVRLCGSPPPLNTTSPLVSPSTGPPEFV